VGGFSLIHKVCEERYLENAFRPGSLVSMKIGPKFMEEVMTETMHLCKNCGKTAGNTGHLCDPVEAKEAFVCQHCGQAATDPRHICKPKLQHINFVCIACGRVAELPSQLCNPRDLVLMAKQEPPTKIV
jgi:DNA-directed RNA polymerase subunit RPC12/RpoP